LTFSRLNIQGSPNLGIYALATNSFVLAPPKTSDSRVRILKETLKAPVYRMNLAGTILLGVYAAANSNGIVVPNLVSEQEIETLNNVTTNIVQLKSRRNAFGNLLLVNDHGAIMSETLSHEKEVVQKIRDALDVEIVVGSIARLPYVGSLASANNNAALVHPERTEEEAELIASVLKLILEQ
jgi:translation initiation factor 6